MQTQGKTRARILGLLPCQYRVQSQYSYLFGDVNDSSNSGISGLFRELLFPATTILIMSQQYWTVTNHKRHRTRALLMFLKPLKQKSRRWGDRFIHCWRRNRMFALFHGDNGLCQFGAGNCISICADCIVASLINWLAKFKLSVIVSLIVLPIVLYTPFRFRFTSIVTFVCICIFPGLQKLTKKAGDSSNDQKPI